MDMAMTYEEAKKKAEEIVYCDLTLGCILYDCEKRGIPTHKKNGKRIDRCTLEQKLIEAMAVEMSGRKKPIDLLATAKEIADRLEDCSFDDCTDSSGYFIVREFGNDSERCVDVYKSTGDGSEPEHYTVYGSFENDDHDFYYTKDLSIEELHRVLKEIAGVEEG